MFLFHDKCLFCKHFCLFVLFFKQKYLHFCLCNHPCCMQQPCKEEPAKNRAPHSCAAWVWASGCPEKCSTEPPAPFESPGSELQAAMSTEELPGTCPVPVPVQRQWMVGEYGAGPQNDAKPEPWRERVLVPSPSCACSGHHFALPWAVKMYKKHLRK